jgi:RND superfamily putative drug exporter
MFSPLVSLQQLGFSLVLGIVIDAVLVRPLLVPCGHWLINRSSEPAGTRLKVSEAEAVRVVDS